MTRKLAALFTVLAVAVACDDTTEPDPHAEPEGVEIRSGANVVVSVIGTTVTGTITATAGQETGDFDFVFVDADGDPIEIDPADMYLEVEIADESIAEFHAHEPGAFDGHFDAGVAGTTTMEIRLMHGAVGSGHADYVSEPVTITVN